MAYSTVYLLKTLESELDCGLDITIVGTTVGENKLKFNDLEYKVAGVKCLNSFKSLLFKLINPKLFIGYFKYDYILYADYGDAYLDIHGVDTRNSKKIKKNKFSI